MQLSTIMCPTDFSRSSHAALEFASALAAESNAFLYIVHVDETSLTYVPGYAGYGLAPNPVEHQKEEERERLNTITPTAPGVEYQHRYLTGNPVKEILSFAERENVDLIVLGSHGRTGLSRILMGSIAEGVVRHAKCPVVTVKQPMADQEEAVTANLEKRMVE